MTRRHFDTRFERDDAAGLLLPSGVRRRGVCDFLNTGPAFFGGSGGGGGGSDPYFSNVSLLLHMDGSNGSTTFTDSSPSPKTVTANLNAQISTSQSKFGGASGYFGNANSYSGLTIPYSSAFDFGAGDFTIECFVYKLSDNSNYSRIWSANADIYHQVDILIGNTGALAVTGTTTGSSWNAFSNSNIAIVSNNQLVHIAVVRSGGNVYAFIDGVRYTLTTTLGTSALVNGSGGATTRSIGGQTAGASARSLNGYIDEFRVTKGVARYTANFTPPTAAFPNS